MALTVYRVVSFFVLSSIILGVIGYVSFLVFYISSSSWVAPLVLSPSQEQVLAFQPQVVNLELALNKQAVELQTAKSTYAQIEAQLIDIDELIVKSDATIQAEAQQLTDTSASIDTLLKSKRQDISRSTAVTANIDQLAAQTTQELNAKLITADQAAQRRISLQSALNSVTDSKALALQLEVQSQQLKNGANTLKGGTTSLSAIMTTRQRLELNATKAQLIIQRETAKQSIDMLVKAIESDVRVLTVAKTSPFYRALREVVTVAFVPYSNLSNIKLNDPVYDCYLQVAFCSRVGKVVTIYDAEEHARHPLFKTELRGKLIEIDFTDPAASKSQVVFVGGKPLLI